MELGVIGIVLIPVLAYGFARMYFKLVASKKREKELEKENQEKDAQIEVALHQSNVFQTLNTLLIENIEKG